MEPVTNPGLSTDEALRRLAARGPIGSAGTSRSYYSILRANIFTVFNLILTFFGVVTLAFGSWQDALFIGILVANTGIGVVQEVRAKLALDRLSALVVPTATLLRNGQPVKLGSDDMVQGDLVILQPGDQLVADGRLESGEGLQLDESILTGESRTVHHYAGDELHSGSFVVEGSGRYTVTAVGPESYAAQVTGEARKFRHPRSPLEHTMNRLLYVLVGSMAPLSIILGVALWSHRETLSNSVSTSVAGIVPLVPEGLILLVNVTFAVSAVRMARRGALAQQINAIESLASVDTICLDKTGTLTEAQLHVIEAVSADGSTDRLDIALAQFAGNASSRNLTLQAISERFTSEPASMEEEVPFSSRWRWSGIRLDGHSFVLGAPELFSLGALETRAEEEARSGRRVVAFGVTPQPFGNRDPADGPPPGLRPLGLVLLAERLRPNARATVEFFQSQGVELKVLSGDRPETVLAIAGDAGIAVQNGAIDGRSLPDRDEDLTVLLRDHSVIGRISPEGKKRAIEALLADGHYVAMIGDGVNDVPGLKAARLAIAQGSGVQMARSVADLVLVGGDFAVVPQLVSEGRTILRNLQRVTKLFVTKSVVTAFMILAFVISPTAYPLLPRHMTLVASLGVGVPAFFVALAPSRGRVTFTGFLKEVARFSIPAGFSIGLGVTASYLVALKLYDLSLGQARTVATTVMLLVMLYLIVFIETSSLLRGAAVLVMCVILFAIYLAVLLLPFSRSFFALAPPNMTIIAIVAGGSLIAVLFQTLISKSLASRLRLKDHTMADKAL